MKIERVKVQNIKGVREIEIIASPFVNELAGKNGAGKSSILDSIIWAFAGKRAITDSEPIRAGEENGEIIVETEDFIITRTFTGDKTTLKIDGKLRGKYQQGDLDHIFGDFTFDPLAFVALKPAQQIETLLELCGKEFTVKLVALENAIKKAEEDQTFQNKMVKNIGEPIPVEKVEGVNIDRLLKQRKDADAHNHEQKELENEHKQAELYISQKLVYIETLKKQIAETELNIEGAKQCKEKLPAIKLPILTDAIDDQIKSANQLNQDYQKYLSYLSASTKLDTEKKKAKEIVDNLKKLRTEKENHIATAKLPISGVEFSETGLKINGTPFNQLSSGEKIRVSAMIGMSVSPELRVMLVRNGSLLDNEGFKSLSELAEKNNYQFWIETVGTGHGDAILIEEGKKAEGDKE